jgi:protein-disulfide isomerase
VIATANGLSFTTRSLSPEVRKAYLERKAAVAAERSRLLVDYLRDLVFHLEAGAQGLTREAVLAAELGKVSDPSAAEIKTVFDANRSVFGERTLEQATPQIVAFLKTNAEQKVISDTVERLKAKHKYAAGKDVNAAGLKPADVVFTLAGKPYTAADLDGQIKAHLYDIEAEITQHAVQELESTIFSTLVTHEAKAKNVDPSDVIATEITNKLREFSDEERAGLETAFKKRLFDKYAVKMLIKEPEPVAHEVSADDDPVSGKADAPVTVVMFSDFQCSACSATHPVLKRVIAKYPGRVRLVVRDFPLESIHEHAFQAALAANAARQQGKYFEYIELLYQNQETLDAANLKAFAERLGLNLKQFEIDFSSEKAAAEVRKDMADGFRHGARGTPTIFINGVRVSHLSADAFREGIEGALPRQPNN